MTLFLRTKDNKTLVDIEIYVKEEDERKFVELHSAVIIDNYSRFLLSHPEITDEVISVFSDLSELRGWLWETYFMIDDNDPKELNNVIKEVRALLNDIASKYDLRVVTD